MSFALAAASLLLVGAGCSANPQASVGTKQPTTHVPGSENADAAARPEQGNVSAKPEAPSTVDASVDAIISDGAAENEAQKGMEDDAADLDADRDTLNSYGSASYDVETK